MEVKNLSDETVCFSANICKKGVPILFATNRGMGGPNEYSVSTSGLRSELEEFHMYAKSWCAQFGYDDPVDAADLWIDWYTQEKPYGITAKMSLSKLVKMFSNHKEV